MNTKLVLVKWNSHVTTNYHFNLWLHFVQLELIKLKGKKKKKGHCFRPLNSNYRFPNWFPWFKSRNSHLESKERNVWGFSLTFLLISSFFACFSNLQKNTKPDSECQRQNIEKLSEGFSGIHQRFNVDFTWDKKCQKMMIYLFVFLSFCLSQEKEVN